METEDGYILQLDRICKNETLNDGNAPRVLVLHGIEDSSFTWIANSVDKAPGFMFADAGIDVWLGNNRGNMFSKEHKQLDTHSADFWDFSFEEMGLYDVPAFIDKILEVTGAEQIDSYVGHS